MRILFVLPVDYSSKRTSGVTTYTLFISAELVKLGHEVTVLSQGHTNTVQLYNGVTIVTRAYRRRKLRGRRIFKYFPTTYDRLLWMLCVFDAVKQKQYDVIESPEGGAGTLLLSMRGHRNIIVRLHKSFLQYRQDNALPIHFDHLIVNMLEIGSAYIATGVTSPSHFMAISHKPLQWLRRAFGVPMRIIPNGVRISNDSPAAIVHKNVLMVGALEPGKGVETLIDAFVVVHHMASDTKLYIAGGDTLSWENGVYKKYRNIIQRKIVTLGLEDCVFLVGQKKENSLATLYANSMIFVAPSRGNENQPMSLLDAVAWCKPLVVTSAGGLPEIVQHEKNGLVVPEEDVSAMAAAITRLLQDMKLRKKFSLANHSLRYTYDVVRTAEQSLMYYNSLVAHKYSRE